jgi:hypothetical protein
MSTNRFSRWRHGLQALAGLTILLAVGCEGPGAGHETPAARPAAAGAPEPEAKKVLVAPNVWLEVQGKRRRVILSASICLREGALELLLCRKNTKEHESVLDADVDGRKVHEALILAGATDGSPVTYRPKFRPPQGTPIRITVEYADKGKTVTADARDWVKNVKTGKRLETDWVFAGSLLVDNPFDPKKPKIYLAHDSGDLICVSNFETAMLDVPIASSKDDADRVYVAFTEHIPPLDTKVSVFLEPVVEKKK